MDTPTQASAYFTIINKCHEVIAQIDSKTAIIQKDLCEEQSKMPSEINSALERELKGLLARLTELNDNLFV